MKLNAIIILALISVSSHADIGLSKQKTFEYFKTKLLSLVHTTGDESNPFKETYSLESVNSDYCTLNIVKTYIRGSVGKSHHKLNVTDIQKIEITSYNEEHSKGFTLMCINFEDCITKKSSGEFNYTRFEDGIHIGTFGSVSNLNKAANAFNHLIDKCNESDPF